MKVSFVALNYAPSRGGAQEHIQRLAEGLVARGHEVEVLTTDALLSPMTEEPGRIEEASEVLGGVTVRRFRVHRAVHRAVRTIRTSVGLVRHRLLRRPTWHPSPWRSGPFPPGQVRAVRTAMRTSDVVVGCSAPFTTLVMPTWFRRGARARTMAMPLLHVGAAATHRATARALRRSDRVMASTTYEAGIDAELGVDPVRVRVVPPGTDPDAFPLLSPEAARAQLGLPERPTVGFVGRLAAYKGVDTVLAAAPAIWDRHPDTTVLIAGSPTGWDGYRSPETAALGGNRFVLREGFPHEERAVLLAACDVLVHPSREESFGLMALEAWAARRPVVLAGIGCVRSFVEPGVAGLLIEPGDHEELARLVGDLLDDPAARERMGAAGRKLVEATYDWEVVCDQWDDAVRTLFEEAS